MFREEIFITKEFFYPFSLLQGFFLYLMPRKRFPAFILAQESPFLMSPYNVLYVEYSNDNFAFFRVYSNMQ